MRLFPKFLVVFLLVALVPLAFVGWRLIRETESTLRGMSYALHKDMADGAALRLHNRRESIHNVFLYASQNPEFLSSNRKDRRAALETLSNVDPAIESVFLFDAVGRPIDSIQKSTFATSAGIADWAPVRKQLLQNGSYWGPPERASDGGTRIVFAAPIESRPGWMSGVLAARIDSHAFGRVLSDSVPEEGSFLYVLDSQGRLVTHSSGEDVALPAQPDPRLLSEAWQGGERPGLLGNNALIAKAFLPGVNWTVFLERPTSLAFRGLIQARNRLLISLLLAGAAAALFCFATTRYLVQPLKELRQAVQKMKSGDFRRHITRRSRDELGDLADEIRQAQIDLEKKTRDAVLGKMARLIGHDLRIPLQTVKNSLDGLRSHVKGLDERGERYFRLILSAADDAEEFIEKILTVGREDALILKPASLNEVAESVLNAMKFRDGVKVEFRPAPDLPRAQLDGKAAQRALANVLKNAHEAVVDDSGGKIAILTRPEEGGVSIAVSDNGPGIPEEKRRRLFEEFSTKRGGSGLGLLIVKKVMDQHKGHVRIESAPHHGTTVVLFFPIRP
ncbi:MAG: sensor histidine kinase [Elusimicrobia bacterium]|nr:sensor histidine kinase [Elusimicrobiota bacterium]